MWVDFLAYHAQYDPHRTAFVVREVKSHHRELFSYGDLHAKANQWATWLHLKGIKPGDRVALWAKNRLDHVTLLFACLRVGAILVPLNFRLGKEEVGELLSFLNPSCLLAEACLPPTGHQEIALEDIQLPQTIDFPTQQTCMDQTVLMLFTSGSTGRPKGVELHAGMLLWNAVNTCMDWELTPEDISVVHTPFFHTGGYNVTCLPLLRLGGRLVLVDKFDPEDMLQVLEEESVSVFFAVPTMFARLHQQPQFPTVNLAALRFCISGGAPCPLSIMEAYNKRGIAIRQGFGLTEVGPNCFTMTQKQATQKPYSIGHPVAHSRVKLLDEYGLPVTVGEIGELCIAGPHVCKGYFQAEDVFAKVYKDGFFHTGDLMRQDEQGFFEVVGRKKDMYISGGENVYPGEVVRALLKHPHLDDAAVMPIPDEVWGEVGFAFLQSQTDFTLAEVRAFLNPLLSRYKHPRHVVCLRTFPLLPNNKPDLKALKSIALAEAAHG